ncbi:glycosyltransferase family 4 protein [Mucilaginibacter sp. BJC16-A38]|uniref:glycosyltransferase family 4 protein n=1 Tax=Mucilaginibacter phenanthrenivorans TaxID=1234842 RepID=UPI0021589080|nr:glycosyltransferase family 4 protein [Mucilaginibacter phenanthrenivorans]MCR8560176.1 glycosyltransferase family 4 protein [Mucilaginibacter phenanthrenivorans]
MKIALIVNPLIPVPPEKYGGIERIVYMIIQELKKNGHEVTLFANGQSKPGTALRGYTENAPYNLKNFLAINLLTVKIAFQGFDLVHTFGRMNNIALLMFSNLPKIVSYQLPPTLSQVSRAVKLARKKSLSFTACSDFIARQMTALCEVSTIYNGVNLGDYDFSAAVGPGAPLVFLGRIQAEKGTALAIQVARESGKKLIIAGNIPEEESHLRYYREMVAPYIDEKNVFYIGPVNDLQKNELLGSAAALLMPVTWDEPFGIVMAEALACGTPVIGFRRGALPEVIVDGLNGYLADSVTEMAACVGKLQLIDRKKCRQVAADKFSAVSISKQYEQLYYKVSCKS